jgi:mono/diheme cytochrome c family protein
MPIPRLVFGLLVSATALTSFAQAADPAPPFDRDIGPLLEGRCFKCHSHKSGTMKKGLTLDSRSGWAGGGDSGPAIVPGKPDDSLLIKAVRYSDKKIKMPPDKKLSDAEIAQLEAWVKAGAPDPRETATQPKDTDWWSLKPIRRPTVPTFADDRRKWVRTPVDAFILAKLREKNLEPSPEADRRVLIRRLTFDLHGLPPTPDEVEAFVADKDPQAYEKLVDRLLDSPRYGERWARHWLDTIHFADTHGFEHDLARPNAWRYRDYVIERFNRDTLWPRFIREQLAADVFFPSEPRLTAALGFLGAGPYDQSTANTAPVTFDYLDRDDLVTQTMAAFASATVNCARCHDHKFDPISQQDYYALQAVFAGVGKGDVTYDEDAAVAKKRKRWTAVKAAAEKEQHDILLAADNEALVAEWEKTRGKREVKWQPLDVERCVAAEGSVLKRLDDDSIQAGGPRPDRDIYTVTATTKLGEVTALRLDVLADDALPKKGPGRQDNGNFHLSEIEVKLLKPGETEAEKFKIVRASADWDQDGWGVAKAIDGNPATAWGIYPKVGESHYAVFELEKKQTLGAGAKLVIVLKQLHGSGHLIGHLKLSATSAPAAGAAILSPTVEAALKLPRDQRTPEQRLTIAAFALRQKADEELARLPAPMTVYAAAMSFESDRGALTLTEPKVVRVLKRGDINKPGAEAKPGSLSAIKDLKEHFNLKNAKDEAARRAALADWLADPDNPLTWRSIANRVWQYHFGRGLCDTPSDFGRMGGKPSHPELLDWLAAELRDKGGSLKKLHRLIVLSATYRQSVTQRDDTAKVDADNRLWWRMNRQRLDAESFCDAVLAISGRLDLTMGGPGVQHFKTSKGPQLTPALNYADYDWDSPSANRRGIYRFVWRGIPEPLMEALDFPDLGLLAPVRSHSVSSLQALTLYNSAFVLHFSERLADRATKLGDNTNERVRHVVQLILLREPTKAELQGFSAYADKHGLAALCRVLFNSNEFLFVN